MNDLKQKIQAAVNLYKSGNFVKCQEITKKLNIGLICIMKVGEPNLQKEEIGK